MQVGRHGDRHLERPLRRVRGGFFSFRSFIHFGRQNVKKEWHPVGKTDTIRKKKGEKAKVVEKQVAVVGECEAFMEVVVVVVVVVYGSGGGGGGGGGVSGGGGWWWWWWW